MKVLNSSKIADPALAKKIEAYVAAWEAGQKFALENLQVGKQFLGGMNVADALGYGRDSLEWRAAMDGAMCEIEKVQVWCLLDGQISKIEAK